MTKTIIMPTSDPDCISAAKSILEKDGIIAFPTDTIYGVAAYAFSSIGIEKIYQAKQRPDEKALPILIGDMVQLENLVSVISDHVRKIAEAFWPGALTMVLPKAPHLPVNLSAFPTIGVRMPDLDFTLALLRETGPLATTSANISGGPNPTSAQDVLDQLGGKIDLLLDGGPTPGATASTVVDATSKALKILRQGPITLAQLQSITEEGE